MMVVVVKSESEKVLQVCFGAKFAVFYSVLLKVRKVLQVCFGAKFAVFLFSFIQFFPGGI